MRPGVIFASLALLFALGRADVATATPLTCAQLASQDYNKEGINNLPANKRVLSITSQVIGAKGPVPEFCQVDLLLDTNTRVRVGLPTATWNGEVENLGAGGFYGTVGSVTDAIQHGYVGSTTNGGHDTRYLFDSSWLLKSRATLAENLLKDYAIQAHQAQYQWALKLTALFYGKKASRNYFNGCSVGGRVSMLMAQLFPNDFDGVLVGAPAINFDRWIASTLYPLVAENIEWCQCFRRQIECCNCCRSGVLRHIGWREGRPHKR
jgi:Tannase and feruloyl esterase